MLTRLDDETTRRRTARLVWAAFWLGLLGGQLHALSRFATDEGREDLESPVVRAWAEPAAELLSPLLEWGSADLVYVHYGKLWAPVMAAALLAALVVRRGQGAGAGRVEAWWWRAALTGYAVATVGVGLSYWTQWSDQLNPLFMVGFGVATLGLMVTLLGSTGLGVTALRRGRRPVLPWLLLATCLPLGVLIATVTSLGNVVLPVVLAFAVLASRAFAPRAARRAPAEATRVS